MDDQPLPAQLVKQAKRAAAACPTLALRLVEH
jgi:ferredoxin